MAIQSQLNWSEFPFKAAQLIAYLASLYGGAIEVQRVRKLKESTDEKLKQFGYGNPLLIEFSYGQPTGERAHKQVVLHTMAPERL